MKRIYFVFFSLFFLLSPDIMSSYGQTYQSFRSEQQQITERSRWRVGLFYIHPSIQFRGIGYDNNVYYQTEENNLTSDYTATISPEVKAYLLFRNWLILSFSENPEYIYFLKESRERSFNNSYSSGMKLLLLQRFVFSGNYHFRKTRRRATSEFNNRVSERIRGYNGGVFFETVRQTSIGVSGSITNISYEDIEAAEDEVAYSRALNREEKSAHFEFYYRIFPESNFFLSGGYTEYKFEAIESRLRDSESYQIYSGVRFPLLGRIRGTLSFGYKKLVPNDKEKKSFSGFSASTNLEARIGRFNLNIQLERDPHFSYLAGNVYFVEGRVGLGLSFYLTQFLRLDYGYSYSRSNYPEETQMISPDGSQERIIRRNIHQSHSAGLVIRIVENTGIGFGIDYWERESSFIGESRNRMFVGGYLTFDF